MPSQVPDLDAIIVPVSGGGLLSGICVGAHGMKPSVKIFGAEPSGASDAHQSFHSGKLVTINNPETICDGLRSSHLGELTFPIIKEHAEDILLASDEEVKNAMRLLWERMKIVVEPSGSIGLAAVLQDTFKARPDLKKIGIVLSGGNVDLSSWKS